jgi:hypothetical protein
MGGALRRRCCSPPLKPLLECTGVNCRAPLRYCRSVDVQRASDISLPLPKKGNKKPFTSSIRARGLAWSRAQKGASVVPERRAGGPGNQRATSLAPEAATGANLAHKKNGGPYTHHRVIFVVESHGRPAV